LVSLACPKAVRPRESLLQCEEIARWSDLSNVIRAVGLLPRQGNRNAGGAGSAVDRCAARMVIAAWWSS
jgi:hypothetical protein